MLRQSLLLVGLFAAASAAPAQTPAARRHLLSIASPDARANQAFESAKAQLERHPDFFALTALGGFENVRRQLACRDATPVVTLTCYDYWLASADDAFLREQWPNIVAAFNASGKAFFSDVYLAGSWIASLEAIERMARAMKDPETRMRANRLLRSVGLAPAIAEWPTATYHNYHRAWAGFEQLRDVRRATLWSVVRGVIGWHTDAPNRAAALEPHLPPDWNTLRVTNLRIGKDRLEATITRERDLYTVSVRRLTVGAPIALRIAPALPVGARLERIVIDDIDATLQSEQSSYDMHPSAEVMLTNDVEVAFHYQLRF